MFQASQDASILDFDLAFPSTQFTAITPGCWLPQEWRFAARPPAASTVVAGRGSGLWGSSGTGSPVPGLRTFSSPTQNHAQHRHQQPPFRGLVEHDTHFSSSTCTSPNWSNSVGSRSGWMIRPSNGRLARPTTRREERVGPAKAQVQNKIRRGPLRHVKIPLRRFCGRSRGDPGHCPC
jgi:hypothetical protein